MQKKTIQYKKKGSPYTPLRRKNWAESGIIMRKIVFLLGLACCWGPSYLCMMWALESCKPHTIAMIRLGIATLVVGSLHVLWKIPIQKYIKQSLAILPFGLFSASIPFTLIALSETEISSSLAAVLNGSTPLFTVFLSVAILKKEKASLSRVLGILVGILGLALVYLPSVSLKNSSGLGFFAMLGASLCYAIGMVYGRTIQQKEVPTSVIIFYQVFYGFVSLLPFVLFFDPPWNWIYTEKFLIASLYTGIISTSLAFFFYQKVLQTAGATYLSTAVLIAPLISLFLGNLFEGEKLTFFETLGTLCIFSGLILVNEMIPKRRKSLSTQSV